MSKMSFKILLSIIGLVFETSDVDGCWCVGNPHPQDQFCSAAYGKIYKMKPDIYITLQGYLIVWIENVLFKLCGYTVLHFVMQWYTTDSVGFFYQEMRSFQIEPYLKLLLLKETNIYMYVQMGAVQTCTAS